MHLCRPVSLMARWSVWMCKWHTSDLTQSSWLIAYHRMDYHSRPWVSLTHIHESSWLIEYHSWLMIIHMNAWVTLMAMGDTKWDKTQWVTNSHECVSDTQGHGWYLMGWYVMSHELSWMCDWHSCLMITRMNVWVTHLCVGFTLYECESDTHTHTYTQTHIQM